MSYLRSSIRLVRGLESPASCVMNSQLLGRLRPALAPVQQRLYAASSAPSPAKSPKTSHIDRDSVSATANAAQSLHKLRVSVVALLHEALTHARKWPEEKGREDRGLKGALVTRLEAQLAQVQTTNDANEVANIGARVEKDLRAILEILRNASLTKNKLPEYVVPEVVTKHEKLLSTKNQAKIVGRKFGWIDRLLTWYLDDKPAQTAAPTASTVTVEKRSGEREKQQQ